MIRKAIPNTLIIAIFLLAPISANAALIDRGGFFIYDDVLDITWWKNAGFIGGGSWDFRSAWVEDLSIADLRPGAGGVFYDDWRLPKTLQPDASCSEQVNPPGNQDPLQGTGTGCTGSEMGHLFNVDGVSVLSPGLFINIHSNVPYWSDTEYSPDPDIAWVFSFSDGVQDISAKDNILVSAWVVRDGDTPLVSVPLPAGVWLFGSALGLLGWLRQKNGVNTFSKSTSGSCL